MNKRSLRIAGWAIGLSLAFGAIGTAVGASQAEPIETKATPSTTTLTAYENDAAWTNGGGTYFEVEFGGDGGTAAKFNASTDIRIYNDTWMRVKAKALYSSTMQISAVTINGKGSKSGKTQVLNYKGDGTLVTGGEETLSFPNQVSQSYDIEFDNANSFYLYQSGPNNVQISSMVITYEIVASDTPTISLDYITEEESLNVFTGQEFLVSATYDNLDGDGIVYSIDPNSTATSTDAEQDGDDFSGHFSTAGNLIVKAKDNGGDTVASLTFVVSASYIEISLDKSETLVALGRTTTLTATSTVHGIYDNTIKWVSSATSVATVANGVVTGVAAGSATVRAYSDSNGNNAWDVGEPNASCAVTVEAVNVFEKVTAEKTIYSGMKVTLANSTNGKIASSIPTSSEKYIHVEDGSFSSDSSQIFDNDALVFTISGKVGEWVLSTSDWSMQTTAVKTMSTSGGTNTWGITFDNDGNVVITSTNASFGRVYYNTSSPRFLNYTSSQASVQLYAMAPENAIYGFIQDYMRMGDTSLSGLGTGACKTEHYYEDAKTAFNGSSLTDEERAAFFNPANTQYSEARKRLSAWAASKGESFDSEEKVLKANYSSALGLKGSFDGSLSIIIAVTSFGLAAAGGLIFLHHRHRKED